MARRLMMALAAVAFVGTSAACAHRNGETRTEEKMEEAGDDMENAAEEAGDKAEEAADDVEDEVDDATK